MRAFLIALLLSSVVQAEEKKQATKPPAAVAPPAPPAHEELTEAELLAIKNAQLEVEIARLKYEAALNHVWATHRLGQDDSIASDGKTIVRNTKRR